MTAMEVAALGGAFASFLRAFSGCFSNRRAFEHFVTYCRGLLGKIPRKSVEPIALAAGAGVRALQWFLSNGKWDHDRLRDMIQQHVAAQHSPAPGAQRRLVTLATSRKLLPACRRRGPAERRERLPVIF